MYSVYDGSKFPTRNAALDRIFHAQRRLVRAILSRTLFILTGFLKPIVTGVDTGVVCRPIDIYPIAFINTPAIARRRAYGKSASGLDSASLFLRNRAQLRRHP